MISIFVALIVIFLILLFVVRPILKSRTRTRHLLAAGTPEVATVVSIQQTGLTINQSPQMELVLDIQQAGESSRRVTTRQIFDLGSIPHAGDLVYLLVDPADPNNFSVAGAPPPSLQPQRPALSPTDLNQPFTPQQTLDTFAISPRLREQGVLGIATVRAIAPTQSNATRFDLEIDAINVPPRRLTITQVMYGETFNVGERVYLLVDPTNPETVAILPLSLSNGQRIPRNANRLDAVVLGPQLMREGLKAQGTITEARQIPMSVPQLTAQGFSRWHLKVHIVPEDGSAAYDAEQDITYTTPEKAQRLAAVGAVVPIRYDAHDPKCFVTNSVALGYPDPYADAVNAMKKAMAHI